MVDAKVFGGPIKVKVVVRIQSTGCPVNHNWGAMIDDSIFHSSGCS